MVINVAQLLQEPVGSTRAVDVSGDEELEVQGTMELVKTDRSILVRGRLYTEVETTCSRCACAITCPVSFDMEEEFFPTVDIVSGAPVELPDDPEALTIDEGHILDLHEAVRQYALLALPIKRLCDDACRGLCQECGRSLNKGECSCSKEPLDARWLKLEALKTVLGRPTQKRRPMKTGKTRED